MVFQQEKKSISCWNRNTFRVQSQDHSQQRVFHFIKTTFLKKKQQKHIWRSWGVRVFGGLPLSEDLRQMIIGAMKWKIFLVFAHKKQNASPKNNKPKITQTSFHSGVFRSVYILVGRKRRSFFIRFLNPFIFEFPCIFGLVFIDFTKNKHFFCFLKIWGLVFKKKQNTSAMAENLLPCLWPSRQTALKWSHNYFPMAQKKSFPFLFQCPPLIEFVPQVMGHFAPWTERVFLVEKMPPIMSPLLIISPLEPFGGRTPAAIREWGKAPFKMSVSHCKTKMLAGMVRSCEVHEGWRLYQHMPFWEMERSCLAIRACVGDPEATLPQ